jgi:capsular polysaccharide biosynthesis protein
LCCLRHSLVESYHINYTLVTGHGTFKEQVELMSKAGVLLLGHGAAATNTIFQPHRSVLIEARAVVACGAHL